MKPAMFNGTGSCLGYQAHFVVAEINLSQTEKKVLGCFTKGSAQGVLGKLSTQSKDYDKPVQV